MVSAKPTAAILGVRQRRSLEGECASQVQLVAELLLQGDKLLEKFRAHGGVFGPGGEVIHQAGSGHEVIAVELDLDQVTRVRERGWHGLGQPLKSLRDTPITFPPYRDGFAASPAFSGLGPLEKPGSERSAPPVLRVIKT